MNAHVLEPYLLPIAVRKHKLLERRVLALVLGVATLIGAALFSLGVTWPGAAAWFCGAIAAALIGTRLCANRAFNYDAIARHIESEHPELQSLLITAMEQSPEGGLYRFNYLQERVIVEAIDKAVQQNWIATVSDTMLKRARSLEWAAGTAFAMVFVLLAKGLIEATVHPSTAETTPPGKTTTPGYTVEVSPGDVEVEAGDRLVVRARFSGKVPPDAVLMAGADANNLQSLTMKKNLEDPIFGGIIPEVNQPMVYRVLFDGQSSETFSASIFRYPELERADATIRPPAYAGQAEESIKDTLYVNVLERSEVTLHFTLNKPVRSARLIPAEGDEVVLTADPEEPRRVHATITPSRTRSYALKLVDDRKRENRKPVEFLVRVHPNEPPEMKFVFPRKDTTVSPLQEILVEAEVYDDIGLLDYGMAYTLSGNSREVILGPGKTQTGRKTFSHLLALETLKAEPNQFIAYHLWAEDLGPNGKRRRTTSDMYFAEIRHFEEIFREMQAPPGESEAEEKPKSGELLKQQKEIISATWNLKRAVETDGDLNGHTNDLQVIRQAQQGLADLSTELLDELDDADIRKHLEEAIQHMQRSVAELDRLINTQDPRVFTPVIAKEQAAYEALIRMRGREYQIMRAQQSKSKGSKSQQSERPEINELELEQQERLYETENQAKKETQTQEEQEQRENLQVLNRLRELARRQDEIKERLKETKHALELAQNEAEKKRLRRELKRLEEQQQELLRDVDELAKRMDEKENRERMAAAKQDLKGIRENVQDTKEQMEKEQLDDAVNSSARAQEKLDELREDFRKEAAGRFDEEMREMRTEARELAAEQALLQEEITEPRKARKAQAKRLDDAPDEASQLGDRLKQQRNDAEDLVKQMVEVSREAETAEPLLSRRLHDAVREARGNELESEMARAEDYLRFDREDEAETSIAKANQAVQDLKEGVEKAAEAVLGDEAKALRQARNTLDDVIDQLNREIQQARAPDEPGTQPEPGQSDPETVKSDPPEEQAEGQEPGKGQQPGEGQEPGEGQQPDEGQEPGKGQQPGEGQAPGKGQQPGEGQEPGKGQQPGEGQQPGQDRRGHPNGGGSFNDLTRGPITGSDFKEWSDQLRDIEEILDQPDLRNETARIRDRAKSERAAFRRHSEEPEWDVVQDRILKPLVELRQKVHEELARKDDKDALVPIDRDPVPRKFEDLVRRYYEKLGEGD